MASSIADRHGGTFSPRHGAALPLPNPPPDPADGGGEPTGGAGSEPRTGFQVAACPQLWGRDGYGGLQWNQQIQSLIDQGIVQVGNIAEITNQSSIWDSKIELAGSAPRRLPDRR